MSRHRFVRNLDLDAEMAEDEDEETMTAEQQEQMATSLSIARQLLADLDPPISDDKIQESLWYYYFDADEAVKYLRSERKKGILQPGRPSGPQPPRGDSAKPPPAEQAAPLTALQKLALSRKAAAQAKAGGAGPSSGTDAAATPSVAEASEKPKSKLAQLAAARKAAASSAAAPANGSSQSAPVAAPAQSTTAGSSKLAQRLAAAKAAASARTEKGSQQPSEPAQPVSQGASEVEMSPAEEEEASPLFNFASAMSTSLAVPVSGPSNFFSLLTARPRDVAPPPPGAGTVRSHGFDGPSPDDVVMQKREKTRLGAGGADEKVEPKKQRVA